MYSGSSSIIKDKKDDLKSTAKVHNHSHNKSKKFCIPCITKTKSRKVHNHRGKASWAREVSTTSWILRKTVKCMSPPSVPHTQCPRVCLYSPRTSITTLSSQIASCQSMLCRFRCNFALKSQNPTGRPVETKPKTGLFLLSREPNKRTQTPALVT